MKKLKTDSSLQQYKVQGGFDTVRWYQEIDFEVFNLQKLFELFVKHCTNTDHLWLIYYTELLYQGD